MKTVFTISFVGLILLACPMAQAQDSESTALSEDISRNEQISQYADAEDIENLKAIEKENKQREREAKKEAREAKMLEKQIKKSEKSEERAVKARKEADLQNKKTKSAIENYRQN